jgi:hypothetical protein
MLMETNIGIKHTYFALLEAHYCYIKTIILLSFEENLLDGRNKNEMETITTCARSNPYVEMKQNILRI